MYKTKSFDSLLGIEGLSNQLLKNHFFLYKGYVNNANRLIQELEILKKEEMSNDPEYSELKRRLGWEFNGMKLHEFYFENMVKGGSELNTISRLYKKITEDFGSYEEWEKDFKDTGMMRGIGWTVLFFDPIGDKLYNAWINEHDAGHFVGTFPILVLDVFEHAFMTDYGIDRKRYIDSFFKIIDWENVILLSESWFE